MPNRPRTEQSTSMISIYAGRQCVGYVLARGRTKSAAIHELSGSKAADA